MRQTAGSVARQGREHPRTGRRPWLTLSRGVLFTAPLLIALIAAVALACDGGGDPSPAESPRQLLERMVLQPQQVAVGLQQAESRFTTNETLAGASTEPDQELARLNELGRILGHAVFYTVTAEGTIAGIQNTVTLFETTSGASESFATAAEEARQTDWASLFSLDQLETEEIVREDLADEVVWIRNSGFQGEGSGPNPLLVVNDDILIRHGLTRGFLRIISTPPDSQARTANVDEAAALVSALVANINNALMEEE